MVEQNFEYPEIIPNWIDGSDSRVFDCATIEKRSPHTGAFMYRLIDSTSADVEAAISSARAVQYSWGRLPAVQRGRKLYEFCELLDQNRSLLARIVGDETGKAPRDALGEVQAAIDCGRFFAGEGQRLYGRTTTSSQPDKYAITVRQPCGVAALIIAANTPIANLAWKVFPALICGNSVVLKAAEDTPAIAWMFSKIFHEVTDIPRGVLNVIQGHGATSGAALVKHADIDVLSFTGSTKVGKWIGEVAGACLRKVSLELGGKNPLLVCDDADLDKAAEWACLSAFSNAGQRCAAGSRIIVFKSVYEEFKAKFYEKTSMLRLGNEDKDDVGPVINRKQLDSMVGAVMSAVDLGAELVHGGQQSKDERLASGYYMTPTIIENLNVEDKINDEELFGPIAQLYCVNGYEEALELANQSRYGLTACIHTKNFNRAYEFTNRIRAGVAVVNAGTYGSEPHMPFGGLGLSGNGSREPGTEAIEIYTELKDVYFNVDTEDLN